VGSALAKKATVALLLAAIVLALAACGGNRYVNNENLALVDLGMDLNATENKRKVLDDLSVDATVPQSPVTVATPKEYDDSDSAPGNRNYTAAPFDIFLDWAEDKGLIGNRYNIFGNVEEFGAFDDGTEYMVLGVEYGFIAIKKTETQGGWNRIKENDAITVYFQYVSFLGSLECNTYMDYYPEMPCGIYEGFEYYID